MEAEINKKNITSKKGVMSYLQILILIVSIFAFAYLLSEAFKIVDAQEDEEEKSFKERASEILGGDYNQVEEYSIQHIEESVEGYACCEKTEDGHYCQFTESKNCDSDFRTVPTECENVEFCKLGCCYSTKTGWCNENTPRRSCEISGGKWTEDQYCNIAECQRGCCVLGRNVFWTTERNCAAEASFHGLQTDFRPDVSSEIECIFLTEKDDEGACVYNSDYEKACKIKTRESCENTGGNFYKNTLCSQSALDTGCEPHGHLECSENPYNDGKSVYWFDSCGNKEEVKEECSIFTGTICGLDAGEPACKSINCEVEINGQILEKKNGESWCEYDGTFGDGRDVVGSRHWKHICFMGEERIEPCQDYRNQICVQSDTDLGSGETFSEAACRINNWRSCIEYNSIEDAKESQKKCEQNPDCYVKRVAAADNFAFNICVPNVPPGFDVTNEKGGKNAEMICGMASQKCTVVYVKGWDGWDCEVNCACEKAGFAQVMNEFCTSLGDCGAYVNYAGESSDDGYSVRGSPKLSSNYFNSLKSYSSTNRNQEPIEPGDLSFIYGGVGIPENAGNADYEGGEGLSSGTGLGIMGAAFVAQVYTWAAGSITLTTSQSIAAAAAAGAKGAAGGASVSFTGGSVSGASAGTVAPGSTAAFANALMSFAAMLAIGAIFTKVLGIEGQGAKIILITSIATGIWSAIAVFANVAGAGTWSLFGTASLGPIAFNPLALLVLVVVIAIVKIVGIGDTKEKIVTFSCMPWQPPTGGDNCDVCNGDPFRPCSSYRCKSLGQPCELINQGTDQQMCVNNNPNDVSSPAISPLYGMITEGYEYYNIKDTGFEIVNSEDKGCVQEFQQVVFGIQTNKPAQCKIGTDPMESYKDMNNEYFGGSSLYLTNHTTLLVMPSPEAFKNQYNLTQKQIEQIGDINFYVRCRSVNGIENIVAYTIRSCVKPGPDLTPPRITKTTPPSGSYMKYNATEKLISVWTNEPANCRWSTENRGYEQMENEMECQQDLEDYELYGWPCNTTLTNLNAENTFYIKCQDISDNKNTMQTAYPYSLKRSASELQITEIKPADGEDVLAGFEPVTVNLEVKTYGGAELGKAECSYKFGEAYDYIPFYDTYSTEHKQVFSSITAGSYTIYVKCEDAARNIAENITQFDVKIDESGPRITRVYYDGSLKVMTDENALCAYSLKDSRCSFDIENSTEMIGEGKEHSADWQTDSAYYIKCKDNYGNEPGRCSIIVRPYNLL